MNRAKFLKDLKTLWVHDKTMKFDLTIADLLDDAATLGLKDAARVYVSLLTGHIDKKKK